MRLTGVLAVLHLRRTLKRTCSMAQEHNESGERALAELTSEVVAYLNEMIAYGASGPSPFSNEDMEYHDREMRQILENAKRGYFTEHTPYTEVIEGRPFNSSYISVRDYLVNAHSKYGSICRGSAQIKDFETYERFDKQLSRLKRLIDLIDALQVPEDEPAPSHDVQE